MRIFPAIDLRGGKCVNLIQGQADAETVFSEDPVAIAKLWAEQGAEYLHLVDLDGAFQGKSANLKIVQEIVRRVSIPTQLGGGIRNSDQVKQILDLGVTRVILGTAALKDPALVESTCSHYPARVVVGIDAKNSLVATEGWINISERPAITFAQEMVALGVKTIVYTDIQSDGMLKGPNVVALEAVDGDGRSQRNDPLGHSMVCVRSTTDKLTCSSFCD